MGLIWVLNLDLLKLGYYNVQPNQYNTLTKQEP